MPLVDAHAVRIAMSAGIGKTIQTRVGGSLDPLRFQPIEVEG